MGNFVSTFNLLTSISTLLFLLLAVYLFFGLISKKGPSLFFRKNWLLIAFIINLAGMIGSLTYSIVIGFPPCDLCWYQRIFMYPLVLIFGQSYFGNTKSVAKAAYPLILVGLIIALYHNYVSIVGYSPLPCGANVSCTANFVYVWGFVTIPLMSFSIFLLSLMLYLIGKRNERPFLS